MKKLLIVSLIVAILVLTIFVVSYIPKPYCNNTPSKGGSAPCICNKGEIPHYRYVEAENTYYYFCEKTGECKTNSDCPSQFPVCYDGVCDYIRGV